MGSMREARKYFMRFWKCKHALMIGLRTVLSSMILLKIKTFWSLLKKK